MTLLFLAVGVILVVAPNEFLRRYLPRYYFGLSEIVHGIERNITWPAILIRFSLPVLAGVIVAASREEDQLVTAASAGVLAALLLVWPMFLHPELSDPSWFYRRREALIVYAMFIATYGVLGLAGGQLGSYMRDAMEPVFDGARADDMLDALRSEATQLIRGIAFIVLGIVLTEAWNRYVKRV